MTYASRPWLAHYAPEVPAEITTPTEPLTSGLFNSAAQWPDRVATDFYGAQTTYAELEEQVLRGAEYLRTLGVQAGDRVAIILPNCPAHVVAFYAVLRLGAVVVEHNPLYTSAELAHQLADSGATVALAWHHAVPRVEEAAPKTEVNTIISVDVAQDLPLVKRIALHLPVAKARETKNALRGPKNTRPDWHTELAKLAPLAADHPLPGVGEVALLQYTGGTTGTPKGAVLTHRNLAANAAQGREWVRAEGGTEVVYGVLPFFHAFGLTLCLTYAVSIGATVVLFPKFDAEAFLAAQRRLPGTFLPAVPTMLAKILAAVADTKDDITSFRYVIAGAMSLPAKTAQDWEARTGGLVIEGYGMTETSPVALGSPLSEARRPGALGLPFPSTDIRIVDQDDSSREVGVGEIGELLIRGPQVFEGYWRRPEETAEQLSPDGWLRTGDIVAMDETGFVRLMDRSKEMIISGGFKVYPSQVEDKIRAMPGVQDVAVVGVPAGDSGESVVAAIVLDPGAHIDLAALRAWCDDKLARYAIPRNLVILADLPRSQIGKVLRRVVRDAIIGPVAPTAG